MAIEDDILAEIDSAYSLGEAKPVSLQTQAYLQKLNPEQEEAVLHTGSPLLILAGAGSGKTRVITTKIAYLIAEKNISSHAILAVTFTKKAANEMHERAILLDERAKNAQIRTFHSFGAWFLRVYAEYADVDPNFTVYDDEDVVSLLQKVVSGLTKKEAAVYAKKIALAKDYCLLPDSPELLGRDEFLTPSDFAEVYARYEERLRGTGNVDFGDLILLPYLALRDSAELRERMYRRFRVILVDEYQDSNVAQFKLLEALSGVRENSGTYLCVVGDDDQSIYKFRGAEIQNILGFPQIFPDTKIVKLESNYRSTPEILAAADSVVRNNRGRLGKTLRAVRPSGKKPVLAFLPNQDEEVQFCAELIQKTHATGVPYQDWAILYRTNAQSLGFENEFIRKKIPYVIVGSVRFFEREEVKDLLAYLELLANKKNEVAFHRVVNKPARSIGAKTQDQIVEIARNEWQAEHFDQGDVIAACHVAAGRLSAKAKGEVGKFADTVSALDELLRSAETAGGELAKETLFGAEAQEKKTLSYLIEQIAKKSGLEAYYETRDKEEKTFRVENMQALGNSAAPYPLSREGLLSFLDNIQLDRTLAPEDDEENKDAVTLITLHNTKGLEFSRVVMTGMEEGIFPRNGDDEEEMEEERRLCYVGITRAMNELYLTSCAMRRLYYGHVEYMRVSPFLRELGNENIKVIGHIPASFGRSSFYGGDFGANGLSHPDFADDPLIKTYGKGARLYHDDYGYGVICSGHISDDGEYVITVQFESGGQKKFIPKYQGHALMVVKE